MCSHARSWLFAPLFEPVNPQNGVKVLTGLPAGIRDGSSTLDSNKQARNLTARSRTTNAIRSKSVPHDGVYHLGNMATLCPFHNNILEHRGHVAEWRQWVLPVRHHTCSSEYHFSKNIRPGAQKQKYRRSKEDYNYSLAGSHDPHSGIGMHMKITKYRAQ